MRTDKRHKQNRPPTKPKPQPATDTPKAASPSPETLAMIAATCSKGGNEYSETAVTYAAKLYKAACKHLDYEKRVAAAFKQEIAKTPMPAKFPATFNDFLRLIVKAKTFREASHRFFDYHRWLNEDSFKGAELECVVEANVKEWLRQGFSDPNDWLKCTRNYLGWWEQRKSELSSAAASQRKLKKTV